MNIALVYGVLLFSPKVSRAWKMWFIAVAMFFGMPYVLHVGCQNTTHVSTHYPCNPIIDLTLRRICDANKEIMAACLETGAHHLVLACSLVLLAFWPSGTGPGTVVKQSAAINTGGLRRSPRLNK